MFCCVVSSSCVVFSWSFFVVCSVFVTERCSVWAVVTCINTVMKVLVFDIDKKIGIWRKLPDLGKCLLTKHRSML